jgi:hypothetical protein
MIIAQHIDGRTFIKVQLKSRPALAKKYQRKDLFIAYYDGATWYLYPHDDVLARLLAASGIGDTVSWAQRAATPGARHLASCANYSRHTNSHQPDARDRLPNSSLEPTPRRSLAQRPSR